MAVAMSAADHDRVHALHQQGVRPSDIAAELGRSLSCIYASIADARLCRGNVQQTRARINNRVAGGDGIVPPQLRLPVEVVVGRYLAEESIETLASSYRVSRAAIRRLLVLAGVTIRANKRTVSDGYRQWSHKEGVDCLRLRAEGLDCASIGLRINRSTIAVICWLAEHNRPTQSARMAERARRRRGELLPEELPPKEVIEQLRNGWLEGRSVAAMAREFDIPSAIVSGVLKRYGIVVTPGNRINPHMMRQAAASLPPRAVPVMPGGDGQEGHRRPAVGRSLPVQRFQLGFGRG
jgi:uncharacterized protein (DUF433 family)